MATYAFTGSLNANTIFSGIYNMIISQSVYADNIAGTYGSLVDKFRIDGTLYGDTKLYYATDVLESAPWGNDAEAQNLLALHRPQGPECQAVTIDTFRQIRLTVDEYLTKQAWSTEGAFSQFNSVMLGWIGETKRIYDSTLINAYVGTTTGAAAKSTKQIALSDISATGEEKNRLRAQMIAAEMANLFVDLKDVTRDYNDYANLRSYNPSDLMVIWNSKYVNEITKLDLPTIFNKDSVFGSFENVLPARFFGSVNTTTGTTGSSNTTVRSMIEKTYGTGVNAKHLFPGDLLPNSTAYAANETYTVDNDVICKVVHKNSVPFMSAFTTSSTFFNPRSLTETHFLTFGYSAPCYLKNYPFITVHED